MPADDEELRRRAIEAYETIVPQVDETLAALERPGQDWQALARETAEGMRQFHDAIYALAMAMLQPPPPPPPKWWQFRKKRREKARLLAYREPGQETHADDTVDAILRDLEEL